MIVFLTFGDSPSGVYWSQVTDVVAYLGTLTDQPIRLVSFVSGRVFRDARREILARAPGAIVLPHMPSVRRWRWNRPVLASVLAALRPSGVICRGVFATDLALWARRLRLVRRVCFDARGAYESEASEYLMRDDAAMVTRIARAEAAAVHDSDFRLAVSHALVRHWQERFGYRGENQVVIPCTLSAAAVHALKTTTAPDGCHSGVRLVFSGGIGGWQSMELMRSLCDDLLGAQPDARILFLSKPDPRIEELARRYPQRCESRWVEPHRVPAELASCDVGILVREDSVTNRVASPVKFAEYLAAGLRVLVSDHLGDISGLVREHGLGWVHEPGCPLPPLTPTTAADYHRMQDFAVHHFLKQAFDSEYAKVLRVLS